MSSTVFIAEVSSNHHQDLDRCLQFVRTAALAGCDAVKFQLFKIDQLFAPEVLATSETHRQRKHWELSLDFIPNIQKECRKQNIGFSCTPFYLEAVAQLQPFVDFFKIASYELLWDDLLSACGESGKPVVLSTGMANWSEIDHAVSILKASGATDLTLLHCVSAYPTPANEANLAVLGAMRQRYGVKVGWSDHSHSATVLTRAVQHWAADCIEFHLDLDQTGAEYAAGHCWLPNEIEPVISATRMAAQIDGSAEKSITPSEAPDREWRADPKDGLRPLRAIRETLNLS